MSKDKQKVTDSEMNENSVNNYKIVFDDENKQDVKTKPKKPKRLTISSTQEAGSGSSGGRRAKTKITPPDAHAYVRKENQGVISTTGGKLTVSSKAVSEENKVLKSSVTGLTNERDSLLDQLASLKSELESLKNPGSHPVPDPPKDPFAKTGGPAGALSKDQYEILLDYIGEQVKLYQDAQAAARSKGKETASESPLDPEAPGPSGAGSPHIGLAAKSSSKSSHKGIVGSSIGGDDTDDDKDDGTGPMDVGANDDEVG